VQTVEEEGQPGDRDCVKGEDHAKKKTNGLFFIETLGGGDTRLGVRKKGGED